MTQYIDKDALLEYLNKLYEKHSTPNSVDEGGVVINEIEYFIGTLEVKEVDLEKEIESATNKYYEECEKKLQELKDDNMDLSFLQLDNFAKHFFELGLKAQKGE